MTTDDLDALERLAIAASPGPWAWWIDMEGGPIIRPKHPGGEQEPADICWDSSMLDADAAYIVAACNAVPALIARIRELEKQIAEEDRYCRICCKDKVFDHEHFTDPEYAEYV